MKSWEAEHMHVRNFCSPRRATKSLLPLYEDLSSVGTASKYRKQGAASLSIQWGTKLADEKGLPGYVEGTPSGTRIYQKYGFEIVDRLKLELHPWSNKDVWNVCMIRPTKNRP